MTQPEILELGQLVFKNEKSLATGLLRHFNEQRTALIESEELRRNLLEKNIGLTDEQILENCQKANEFCKDELWKMQQEESLYLQLHPEIEAINAKQANTFLYVIRNDDMDKIPSRFILNKQKGEEMPELVVAEAGEPYNFRPYGPSKEESIIASQLSVNSPLIKSLPVKPAYNEENQIDIINLESKLVLIEKNNGSLLTPGEGASMEYQGLEALQRYSELKFLDREGAREIQQANRLSRKDMVRMDVLLSYNGKQLTHMSYEQGTGKLCNEGISLNGLIKENEELKRAVYVATKVCGGVDNNGIRALQNEEHVNLPTPKEMQNEILKKKPSSRTVNYDLYEYYQDAASQDLSNNTLEKVQSSMVDLMKEQGLRDLKIQNICKTHESFNLKLLEKEGNRNNNINPEKSRDKATDAISPKEALMKEITLEKENLLARN